MKHTIITALTSLGLILCAANANATSVSEKVSEDGNFVVSWDASEWDRFGSYKSRATGSLIEKHVEPNGTVTTKRYPIGPSHTPRRTFVGQSDGGYTYSLEMCGQYSARNGGCLAGSSPAYALVDGTGGGLLSGGADAQVASFGGFVRDFVGSLFDDRDASRWSYECSCNVGIGTYGQDTGLAYIKSIVNQEQDRWVPGDLILLKNGEKWAVYQYQANGNFVIVDEGTGEPPFEGENEEENNSESQPAQDSGSNSGGGSRGGSSSGQSGFEYSQPNFTPDYSAYNPPPTPVGHVTSEEYPPPSSNGGYGYGYDYTYYA